MANAKRAEQQHDVAVIEKPDQLPAVIDYAADAGAGMEGTTQDSFAIPFLSVLQKGSPQVDENDGKYMQDAKPGMFLNTINSKLYDGKEGVLIIPCAYRRVFLHWGPRQGEGQGFKGEHTPESVAKMRAERKIVEFESRLYVPLPDGSINDKRCDRFADTRNHYCIVFDEKTGEFSQVLMSLTSTQIKKSKGLMTLLAEQKVRTPNGLVTPPTFAFFIRATTVPESNDQGSWFGYRFEMHGPVKDNDLYQRAKAFHASVTSGMVTANYEESAGAAAPAEAAASGF